MRSKIQNTGVWNKHFSSMSSYKLQSDQRLRSDGWWDRSRKEELFSRVVSLYTIIISPCWIKGNQILVRQINYWYSTIFVKRIFSFVNFILDSPLGEQPFRVCTFWNNFWYSSRLSNTRLQTSQPWHAHPYSTANQFRLHVPYSQLATVHARTTAILPSHPS